MEWYIPITIIPGIGMLVLSTTNQMMALSGEIERLLGTQHTDFQHHVADLKIKQLSRLTTAGTLLYVSAAFYVMSGLLSSTVEDHVIGGWILTFGVAVTFLALAILITYSFKAIKIRRIQHQHNLTNQNNYE